MFADLLKADIIGILLFDAVLFIDLEVFFVSLADNGLQRCDDLVVLDFARCECYRAYFDASGGLNDHFVVPCDLESVRIEIIYFPSVSETDTDYSCHKYLLFPYIAGLNLIVNG